MRSALRKVEETLRQYGSEIFKISAKEALGVKELVGHLKKYLVGRPRCIIQRTISDQPEQLIAAEADPQKRALGAKYRTALALR